MKKRFTVLLTAILFLFLTGCSRDSGANDFHDSMDAFYQQLSVTINTLENIEPASESAVEEVLSQLDSLDILFRELAAISVPEELKDRFENVETLAADASDCMAQANELYHEAYADNGYHEDTAQRAWEYYSRAMKRVNYIALVLQGRLPEGDDISVISETDTPEWNGDEAPAETPISD